MGFDGSWRAVEEVVVDIIDRRGVTPTKLGGEFTSSGHRVISAKLMKGGRLDLAADEPRFVEPSIYEKWMRSPLQSGDVLMTSEAPLGELAYMAESADWCLGQRLFALRPNTTLIDGRFLYYALQTAEVRADINSRASGTTVLGIRQAELRKVRVPVPSLDEQKLASSLLGALDDRIDLLRQTNATLETIAQALFKSWFVDFDPVRAKAEGREPEGMDPATAALFPSEFEDSELGLIPKGWRILPLSESLSPQLGGAWGEESESEKASINVSCLRGVDAVDIGAGRMPDVPNRWVSPKQAASRVLNEGDILVEGSGSFCGRSLYWIDPYAELLPNRPIYSNFVKRFASAMGEAVSLWASMHLTQIFESGEVVNYRTGSAFPNLDATGLLMKKVATPDSAEPASALYEIVRPLLERKKANIVRAATLAALRDTLVPRLISGKLRLPGAEAHSMESSP